MDSWVAIFAVSLYTGTYIEQDQAIYQASSYDMFISIYYTCSLSNTIYRDIYTCIYNAFRKNSDLPTFPHFVMLLFFSFFILFFFFLICVQSVYTCWVPSKINFYIYIFIYVIMAYAQNCIVLVINKGAWRKLQLVVWFALTEEQCHLVVRSIQWVKHFGKQKHLHRTKT